LRGAEAYAGIGLAYTSPLKAFQHNVAVSTTLLLLALLGVWLLAADTVVQFPPGPKPWYSYSDAILALVLLPVVPCTAARFSYWLPAFFGFGVFIVFPTACFVLVYFTPPHPVLTTIALCCVAGIVAAFIGLAASRMASANNRNAQAVPIMDSEQNDDRRALQKHSRLVNSPAIRCYASGIALVVFTLLTTDALNPCGIRDGSWFEPFFIPLCSLSLSLCVVAPFISHRPWFERFCFLAPAIIGFFVACFTACVLSAQIFGAGW